MANAIYPKWKEQLMNGAFSAVRLGTQDVRAVLVDTGVYTYNPAHQFRSDLTGIVGSPSVNFTNKTFVDGVFDADNINFTSVTGNTAEAIVIYTSTGGGASDDRLVVYLDSGFTGLPVTPDGSDIPVTWNASGIFAL